MIGKKKKGETTRDTCLKLNAADQVIVIKQARSCVEKSEMIDGSKKVWLEKKVPAE